jgi:Zn-dependent protease with chaperone function
MLNLINLIGVIITLMYSVLSVTAIAFGGKQHNLFWMMNNFTIKHYLTYINYGYAIVFALATIVMTPLGDKLLTLFFSIRGISHREEFKVKAALEFLSQKYQELYGKKLNVKVLIEDNPYPQAMALGRKTMVVSTGLLKTASDQEITAVMAHELGHLHYLDGVMNLLMLLGHTFICRGIIGLMLYSNKFLPAVVVGWMLILGAMSYSIYGFLYFGLIPLMYIIKLIRFCIGWPIEYRADKFAISFGLGQGLITFFEKIEGEDVRSRHGFLSTYQYSHPPTALRISKIEKQLIKHEKKMNKLNNQQYA